VHLATKVDDGPVPHGIDGAHHMDLVTQVDGPVVTEVLLCLVSTTSGCGQRWNPTAAAPSRYQRLKTLANEWEVLDYGIGDPINKVVWWGPRGVPGRLACLGHACLPRACSRSGLLWSTGPCSSIA
jgi:hypothetical protein